MTLSAYLLFCVSNGLAIVLASRLTRHVTDATASIGLRLSVGTALYILLCSMTTLGVGLAGVLNIYAATAVLLVLLAGERLLSRRAVQNAVPSSDTATTLGRDESVKALQRASMVVAPALGLASWWLIRNVAMGTYITNDDNAYHAVTLVYWLKLGAISIPPFTYQAYYPYNSELLSLWYLLPAHSDAFVGLNGVVYLLLFACISVEFCRRLDVPRHWWGVPTLIVLGSTQLYFGLTSFADTDFSPPVMTLTAALFLWSATDAERPRTAFMGLAGACAGFAVGMKVSCAPAVALVALTLLLRTARRGTWPHRLSSWATFASTAAVCGGYWYLRNWLVTGNPLYPAELGPFDGPFSSAEQRATSLAHVLRAGLSDSQRSALAHGLLDRPYPVALLYLAGVVSAWWHAAKAFDAGPLGHKARLCLLLAGLATLTGLIFPIMPFSGQNEVDEVEVTGRYMNLMYLAGTLALPVALGNWTLAAVGQRLTAFVVICIGIVVPFAWKLKPTAGAVAITVSVLAFAALEWPAARSRLSRWSKRVRIRHLVQVWPAVLAVVALSGWLSWNKTGDAAHEGLQRLVAGLPAGSRVSLINDWLFRGYILYGQRYELDPVRVEGDGRRMTVLHRRDLKLYRGQGGTFWQMERPEKLPTITERDYVANLRAAGVEFLLITPAPNGEWPDEATALRRALHAEPWQHSDAGEVWDLRASQAGGR